jgi:hypothetical protein
MPMPQSPVTWEATLNRVAEMLSTTSANLPSQFAGICSQATRQAWIDVYQAVGAMGYSAAHIQSADQLKEWTLARAAVLACCAGTALAQYDLNSIKAFDPLGDPGDLKRKNLFITINGEAFALPRLAPKHQASLPQPTIARCFISIGQLHH